METQKCCVGGCIATRETHRLFSFPKNDNLRHQWISFLVPTNSFLLGLSKEQLLRKRVCVKHFDRHQFNNNGRRLRYSYPCLLTNTEIAHGVPLIGAAGWDITLDHNYFKEQGEEAADTHSCIKETGDHNYCMEQVDTNIKTFGTIMLRSADIETNLSSCIQQAVDSFINVLLRLQVHNWCNIVNKILNGAIEEKYILKMSEPQKLALMKYKSFRCRKKCLNNFFLSFSFNKPTLMNKYFKIVLFNYYHI